MRLFVAVEIDPAVAQKISDFNDALRRRAMSCAARAQITWVPREQLHVTVRFIGEVDAAQAAAIVAALRPELTTRRFEMIVEGAGAFPPTGAPRVLWAGIGGRDRRHLGARAGGE